MPPAATMTSPTMLTISPDSFSTVCAQRTFSPPSPPSRRSARSSLTVHSSALSASSCFFFTAASKSASNLSRRSVTSFNCACKPATFFSTISSSAIAPFSATLLGSTSNATKWYVCIARVHWHIASQALETDLILDGWKLASSMTGWICLITLSGMLSLS